MATQYTISQAYDIICEHNDAEAMKDLGSRYPLLTIALGSLTAARADLKPFLESMPDYMTGRKMESALRRYYGIDADAENADKPVAEEPEEQKAEEKPAPKRRKKADTPADGSEVKAEDKPAKRRKKAEKPAPEPDPAEEQVEAERDGYEGMSAVELFKECKRRGIQCKTRKPADYYVDLLRKDDESASDAADDDDEDWEL